MTMPKQEPFNGEMRVLVNKRLHPNMDSETLQEHVQTILQGGTVEGIEVQLFEVRGDDRTDEVATGSFDFAAGFQASARVVSKAESRKKSKEDS